MEEEMIEKFDYVRLEVVDSWQLPAVYIVYKNGYKLDNVKDDYFIKELDDEEHKAVVQTLNELGIAKWQNDYLPERNEKIEEQYMWKIIVSKDGRTFVKKGKNKCPDNFSKLEDFMIANTYLEDEE